MQHSHRLLPAQDDTDRRIDEAQARFRAAIMGAFGETLRRTDMTPLAALRLAALAMGSVYREVADAHSAGPAGSGDCPCGWRPHPASDVELLCSALMSECRRRQRPSLRTMPVAGTA